MPNEGLSLAVAMMPLESRREAIMHLATTADEQGYKGVFLPETWSHTTPVLLTEAALKTENIVVGTGILGIWGRSAATIAMEAASLDMVSMVDSSLDLAPAQASLPKAYTMSSIAIHSAK